MTFTCRHPANTLLPWHVNGTLQACEQDWVQAHLDACPVCARECEELSEVSEGLRQHQLPIRSAAAQAPLGRSRLLAVAAAILLALPAGYGVWLVARGDGAGSRSRSGSLQAVALIDLGAGPTRSFGSVATLDEAPGARTVIVSFIVPATAEARYSFDLEGPQGVVLLRGAPIERLDASGRYTCALPASLLATRGDYAIVVRVATATGDVRLYPYPFKVGQAASPREG